MTKFSNYLLLIFCSSLLSCSPQNKEEEVITFDEKAYIDWFNSFNPQWRRAIQENEPSYIIERYADNAIIGAPNRPFLIGKTAISSYWQNLAVSLDDFAYETQHIGGNPNDILYENGLAFATYTLDNRQVTDTTKYLFVWKHIGNKEYKVVSEMLNPL